MLSSETDPKPYITEYTLVYEFRFIWFGSARWLAAAEPREKQEAAFRADR